MDKNLLDFDDLDPIFKVAQGLRMLEKDLSASCIRKEWVDFDQTAHIYIYCWDMDKNWIDFGDVNSFFKVIQGLRMLINSFSAPYFLKE